jgi:hypothetical protein
MKPVDVLHWVMRISPYRPGGMVIESTANLATFFYIIDYKMINYPFFFCNSAKSHRLAQPIVCDSLVLDWVRLSNSRR